MLNDLMQQLAFQRSWKPRDEGYRCRRDHLLSLLCCQMPATTLADFDNLRQMLRCLLRQPQLQQLHLLRPSPHVRCPASRQSQAGAPALKLAFLCCYRLWTLKDLCQAMLCDSNPGRGPGMFSSTYAATPCFLRQSSCDRSQLATSSAY